MNNEELQEKFEQLASTIDWIKTKIVELQEEKGIAPIKAPCEVEVPEDLEDYFYVDETGLIYKLSVYVEAEQIEVFKRGLAFKTKEEAEKYDKERILLFKLHKWAEEHNEGWTPDWNDFEDKQYYVVYDYEDKQFYVRYEHYSETFTKLPYLKSYDLAEQFIEEFGKEIKEVLL